MTKSCLPRLSINSKREALYLYFCGICMGAADLVPGISGGTIAFILGFYQPLLESLKTFNSTALRYLLTGQWGAFSRQVAWKFLLIFVAGVSTAFICLANVFQYILMHETYRVYFYATFLGLILASFILCIKQIKKWNGKLVTGLCLGSLIAYVLTNATVSPMSEGKYAIPIELQTSENVSPRNYDSQCHLLTGLSTQVLGVLLAQGVIEKTAPVYNQQHRLIGVVGELVLPHPASFFNIQLVVCGALAVCALLLPGISGSYILMLLGVYPLVIESLAEFIRALSHASFHHDAFIVLWSLSVGVIIGAIFFSKVISLLMRDYPDECVAVLCGFMAGAIRSVWPFWSYEYLLMPLKLSKGPQLVPLNPCFPSWDSPMVWIAAGCALLGFILIFFLSYFQKLSTS